MCHAIMGVEWMEWTYLRGKGVDMDKLYLLFAPTAGSPNCPYLMREGIPRGAALVSLDGEGQPDDR